MEIISKIERKLLVPVFIKWYFIEHPRFLLRVWLNLLKFNIEFFSIPFLLKTFFSYFHGYKWVYEGRGIDIWKFFEVKMSNIISRTMGALIRSFIIIFGLIVEFIIFLGGAGILFFWIFGIFFCFAMIIYGLKFLL